MPGKKPAHHRPPKSHGFIETTPPVPADEMRGSPVSRHRVVVAKDHEDQPATSAPHTTSHVSSVHGIPQGKKSPYAKDSRGFDEKHLPHTSDERLRTKEMERQIIEKELQRQRMMAIPGRTPKSGLEVSTLPPPSPEIVRLKREVTDKPSLKKEHEPSDTDTEEVVHKVHRKRTVIIQKKKVHPGTHDTPVPENETRDANDEGDDLSGIKRPIYPGQTESGERKVSIKNSAYKSKDEIFEGKGIQKTTGPQVKDSTLIHTDLKPKKTIGESKSGESDPGSSDQVTESSRKPKKGEKNTSKKDDISWI